MFADLTASSAQLQRHTCRRCAVGHAQYFEEKTPRVSRKVACCMLLRLRYRCGSARLDSQEVTPCTPFFTRLATLTLTRFLTLNLSQGNIVRKDIMWGLLIPLTVFRVCYSTERYERHSCTVSLRAITKAKSCHCTFLTARFACRQLRHTQLVPCTLSTASRRLQIPVSTYNIYAHRGSYATATIDIQ